MGPALNVEVSLFEDVVLGTLLRPMEFSIKFDLVISEYAIIYIIHVIIFKQNAFHSLKVNSALANSEIPDEMPHYAAFHHGLLCLPNYPFRDFRSTMGE